MTLKNGLVHQSMIKEEEKDHCLHEKKQKSNKFDEGWERS